MERDDIRPDPDLADALRRLNAAAVVPPADPSREAALMAAFDAAVSAPRGSRLAPRRHYWHLAAFAAAAAVLIAVGIAPSHTPPPPARDVRLESPNDFTIVPGAAGLPAMESGTLVRMDVPVTMLPSLGLAPPAGRASIVQADFIVAQDGLPRAVRVVAP